MVKIMVVDDVPEMVQLISDILEPHGYDVIQTHSGEEALGKLEDTVPDLVLLDIMMPGMDGFEVCRRIRKNPVTSDMMVVFVTGRRDCETHYRDSDSGHPDGYILKPFSLKELVERVTAFLERNRKEYPFLRTD
jgi:DNA-binding response OmpR family regulator